MQGHFWKFTVGFYKIDYQGLMIVVIWDKAFKNGPSKICGRQPLKSLK